ncbi:PKD domain-containing protein, partial [Microbispora triticiradicis]|uniref:PKD domain-containing protein n=1 Tax=Microbispora triticiradicis TaxID=2200763 RepID=UPI001AD7A035
WVVDGEERGPGALTLTMDGPHTVEARFGTYTVTELGALPGGDAAYTNAVGLNDRGQVAATVTGADGKRRAARWQDGAFTELGGPACTDGQVKCETGASGINEAGDVSGSAVASMNDRNVQHAVVWPSDGSVTDLHAGSTTAGGSALGLNDNGQVFGWNGGRLAVWERGQATALPDSPEFFTNSPSGARALPSRINASGAVAGGIVTGWVGTGPGEPVSWSPAVYQHGVITPLAYRGCEGGVAYDINDAGLAAGAMGCTGQGQHAFTWKDGEWTDLGAGSATALNDNGVVAGHTPGPKGADDPVPALWVDGKRYKLADVLPRPYCPARTEDVTEPCIRLTYLYGVNSSGQILAQGLVRDRSETVNGFPYAMRSFLLTPTTDQADLQVTTEASAVEPGPASTVTWTATVVNKGPDPATDVRLDVLVPDALAGTAACETFRGKCSPIKGGFRNTVKVLQPGWEATVEITATVPADAADGTELKVQANADSVAVADPQPDDNGAAVSATVRPLLSSTGVNWPEPVRVGTTSYPSTVTLTNRLNAPIPLKAIGVEGPFAQSNSCPVELPVGDKCTVTLTFTPTVEGAASGKLAFTTAEGAEPAYTVTLTGTGAAANAKPVVQVPSAPLRGVVGQPFTLRVDFTDADATDTHTAQLTWGDGPPGTATVEQRAGGGTVTASKIFASPISGMAVVMVSDGKETTWQGVPYVIEAAPANSAPVVTAGSDAEVTVGEKLQRIVSFTDADSTSWTASADYGDGAGAQPVTPMADKRIGLEHQWASAGTYTVTVKVKDDGGLEGTARFTVTVLSAETPNQAPKVTLLGYDAPTEAGGEWVGRGSFVDPDSSSWTYTADYGDGAGPQPLTPTAGQLKLSHVYDTAGDYTVVLTVTDDKGGTGSAQLKITIVNPAPEVTLTAPVTTVAVGQRVTLAGSFTDKATGDTHTATWDIGGKQVTGALAEHNGKGTLTLPYRFTKPGLYQVSVTVADNHGARTTADTAAGKQVQVLVFDRDASLTGAGTIDVPAGACTLNAECAAAGEAGFTVSAHYPATATAKGKGKGKGKVPAGEVSYTAPGFTLHGTPSVVSSAGGTAILRGTGQVKGAGPVSFEITATDTGAGRTDRFHLVVWDAKGTRVYDGRPTGAPAPVTGVLRVAG